LTLYPQQWLKTISVSRTSASRWRDRYRWVEGGINNDNTGIFESNERGISNIRGLNEEEEDGDDII